MINIQCCSGSERDHGVVHKSVYDCRKIEEICQPSTLGEREREYVRKDCKTIHMRLPSCQHRHYVTRHSHICIIHAHTQAEHSYLAQHDDDADELATLSHSRIALKLLVKSHFSISNDEVFESYGASVSL